MEDEIGNGKKLHNSRTKRDMKKRKEVMSFLDQNKRES